MHMGGPNMTQNQGNILGDRPCVRQSKLYREHVGGNAMKDLMGQGSLKWDTNNCQGAYTGQQAHDALGDKSTNNKEEKPVTFRRGSGYANKQSYNILNHQ